MSSPSLIICPSHQEHMVNIVLHNQLIMLPLAFLDDWVLFLSKASLITDHASEVTHISTEMNARYLALQKQHQDFVNHWNSQITTLEQQLLLQSRQSCYEYHCVIIVIENLYSTSTRETHQWCYATRQCKGSRQRPQSLCHSC